MTNTPQPSPELFFETANAHQRTAALKAAVELDLFSAIGKGSLTAAETAAKMGTPERSTRILCDYLTIIGFLTKTEGRYALTPGSALFLDRGSPAYLGGSLKFLHSPTLRDAFADLAQTIRRGTTILDGQGSVTPENDVWVDFARSMVPLMMMPAQQIAGLVSFDAGKPAKVLDIAAGHGMFGIVLAQKNPSLEVVALDWPKVLEVATENAARFGVAGRHRALPGDAFQTDFGTGYDAVLLTNFLHHFDIPTCETLLRKVAASLKPGGRVVTLEFVPNEDRVSPPGAASFAMMMLGTTPQGDAYTFAEYQRMFGDAGFSRSELHTLRPGIQSIVISHK